MCFLPISKPNFREGTKGVRNKSVFKPYLQLRKAIALLFGNDVSLAINCVPITPVRGLTRQFHLDGWIFIKGMLWGKRGTHLYWSLRCSRHTVMMVHDIVLDLTWHLRVGVWDLMFADIHGRQGLGSTQEAVVDAGKQIGLQLFPKRISSVVIKGDRLSKLYPFIKN